jgi:hypothetical protein
MKKYTLRKPIKCSNCGKKVNIIYESIKGNVIDCYCEECKDKGYGS